MQNNRSGFTFVELIVVVTILTILSTIGFVSYSGYLTSVRDTNRTVALSSISDGLNVYQTKGKLPYPDDSVDVIVNGTTIAKQGYAGESVLETIDYSQKGLDPDDKVYFSYYLTSNRKHFQLLAFLEEEDNSTSFLFPEAYANVDYSIRYPYVFGSKLGILTDTDNTPIQEVVSGSVEVGTGNTTNYKAFLTDTDILQTTDLSTLATAATAGGKYCTGTSGSIVCTDTNSNQSASNTSCRAIYETQNQTTSGIYTVNPTGSNAFDVYCDMTNNGGGWMLVANIQSSSQQVNTSAYENGLGTPDLNNLNSGAWVLDMDDYISTGETIRVNMGTVVDFFQPVSGSTLRAMMLSNSQHQWSADGSSYQTPSYYPGHLGGSADVWPQTNIAGDNRRHLSFWGSNSSNAGCCSDSLATHSQGFGRTFQVWIK